MTYKVDHSDLTNMLTPHFLRDADFLFHDGDFAYGDTINQDVQFILQANKGHFYNEPKIGVGLTRMRNASIDVPTLKRLIRENLNIDGINADKLYILTAQDLPRLGITDKRLISILDVNKYLIHIEASR